MTIDSILTHGDEFPNNLLPSTDWADFTNFIMGTLVPNFFITYFGQQLPYRDLSDDNVIIKLTCLGFGYELWTNTAKDAIKKLDDILTIMADVKTPEKIKILQPNLGCKQITFAGYFQQSFWYHDHSPIQRLPSCRLSYQRLIF
jgi:hypothetical protein